MNDQVTNKKHFIVKNFKKSTVALSALMFVCALFAGTLYASGDERHERYEYEGRERHRGESKIYGSIEKMPEQGYKGTWIINGRQVLVSDSTRIKEKYGRAVAGSYVEVKGVRNNDNSFTAYEIEVERSREDRREGSKFYGTVEFMPQNGLNGIWKINGREVVVTQNTRIKEEYGRLKVGSSVEVEGSFSNNTFTAYEIEVKDRR